MKKILLTLAILLALPVNAQETTEWYLPYEGLNHPIVETDTILIGGTATTTTGNIFEVIGNSLVDLLEATTFKLGSDSVTDFTGTGLTVSGGALQADSGTVFFLSDWFATTTHALISSLPSLSITESQISDLSHTVEADTLQTVTDRGATTDNDITIDNGGLTNNNLNLNGSTHSTLRSSATDLFQILHNGAVFQVSDTGTYKLNKLTSNGFLKTGSGDGTLSVDTSTYLTDITGESLESLSDVASFTQTLGDLLYWNGSAWSNIATSTLNIATSDLIGTIDISDQTNLAGDSEIVLTNDTLSIASSIARDSELHDAVTVSGTPDYITLSGQDIVRGTIDIGDDTNLVGGTNLTLSGDTLNVDDAFISNSGADSAGGLITFPSGLLSTASSTFSALLNFGNATGTQLTLTDLFISGDQINDFAGTGLTVTGNALTADLGTAITSSEITDDEIVNADINSSAAIAYSKLSLTNSLLEADLKAVDTAADEECLTYEATGGDFEWQACSSGGSGTLNTIERQDFQVGDSDIVTLDFGTFGSNVFSVSESPDTEINIDLDLNSLTAATPAVTDVFLFEDNSDSWNHKKVSFVNFNNQIDHGSVLSASLSDDDHTQYALLAGRAGGQTLYGDTATAGDLRFISTTKVGTSSKGFIYFGESDEAYFNEPKQAFVIGGGTLGVGEVLNVTGDFTLDGALNAKNYIFDTDQTVGSGQDDYILTYDNGDGEISLEQHKRFINLICQDKTGWNADTYMSCAEENAGSSENDAKKQARAPGDITLTEMYCFVSTAPGAGDQWDIYVRDDGASVGSACTIAGASATTCSVTGMSASIASHSTLNTFWQEVGTNANTGNAGCHLIFEK